MTRFSRILLIVSLVLAPSYSFAQLVADGPVVYGHHHLNVSNIDAHKKFWADTLGGTVVRIGPENREVIKVPNVFIFLRMQAPTAGSKGSTADHIAFSVPNLQATLDKVRANGFRVATAEESPASYNVKSDIAYPSPTTLLGFVFGPDDVKVELIEAKTQTEPIKLHHIHFMGEHNAEMRDWYVKTFGAMAAGAAPNAPFLTASLPGVRLQFSPSTTAPAPTTGRAYDHIGFEVKNLPEFLKNLEAQGIKPSSPLRRVEGLALNVAFITDPWGTNIELTEGLTAFR
jgi:catechol 2,3-dioxygenase-like lactoylglutathione lyase family enzyme